MSCIVLKEELVISVQKLIFNEFLGFLLRKKLVEKFPVDILQPMKF